jgi:hypothetical protein
MPQSRRRSLSSRRLVCESLETRSLMAGVPITSLGIAGDSITDEYEFEAYDYARNWAELLHDAEGVNLGAAGTFAEPRREGYAFNWARSGAPSGQLLSQGQHTGLAAQINAGQVSHALLQIGQDDFVPEGDAYYEIAKQLWTAQQITDYSNLVVGNIETALSTLYKTNAFLVMTNIVDYGVTPATQAFYTPTEQQRVTDVIEPINVRLATLADKYNVPLVDFNGVTRNIFGDNFNPVPSKQIGGNTINNAAGAGVTNAFVDDGIHPHTIIGTQIANLFLTAFNKAYDTPIDLFTEQEACTLVGLPFTGNTLNLNYGAYVKLWNNSAPVLSGVGGTSNYTENAAATLVATAGVVSDADNLNFARGVLTVKVSANANANDRLAISHQGNAAGQIGIEGANVKYGGVKIGTFSGGSGSTALTVKLNGNASKAAVQALLRRVSFKTLGEAPTTATRTLTFKVSDGDKVGATGAESAPVTRTVTVTAKNDKPVLGLSGSLNYVRNANPVLLAASATLTDPDSADFNGGTLTVKLNAVDATNRLGLSGGFTVSGGVVFLNGTTRIGTLTKGTAAEPEKLVIKFDRPAATKAVVQQLIRSINFKTVNGSAGTRTVTFQISDGDGGTSDVRTKTVNVT